MATSGVAPSRHADMISWPLMLVFTVGVGALAASPAAGTVILGGCVAAALIGPAQALQALAIATLIAYGNVHIIKPPPMGGVLLRLVLVAGVLRAAPTLRGSDLRLLWPVWLFAVVEGLSSMLTSPAVEISIMKSVEFFLGITVVVAAYNHVRPSRLERLQRWLVTLGVTVIGLSALTLFDPGIGLGTDGGLEGLLNQPQALGIFMAPFAAWALAGALLMRRGGTRLELWLALALTALIIMSKARTAGFGTACGVFVVMGSRALGKRRLGQATLARPVLITVLACGTLVAIGAATGGVSKILTGYVYKYKSAPGQAQNLDEAFYKSRGGGALDQWDSFLDKPLLGNGFGVFPDGHFPAGVTTFDGIPISAPVEKGFLPTAILQEGGVVGAALLVVIIATLWRRTWRNTDLRWRAMFVACLGINIGECVLMSPGGIGMFDWLLLSLAMFSYRAAVAPVAREPAEAAISRVAPLYPELG